MTLILERGPIRVLAVGGDSDGGMTLTAGRIVLDPISARPRYAWSSVRRVRSSAQVDAELVRAPDLRVIWYPHPGSLVSAPDATALLEQLRAAA